MDEQLRHCTRLSCSILIYLVALQERLHIGIQRSYKVYALYMVAVLPKPQETDYQEEALLMLLPPKCDSKIICKSLFSTYLLS